MHSSIDTSEICLLLQPEAEQIAISNPTRIRSAFAQRLSNSPDTASNHTKHTMALFATNTTLCQPLRVPGTIPGVDMKSDWCAMPNISNKTVEIMQYCCGETQQVQTVDGCAWCYLSYPIPGNFTMEPTMKFSACVGRKGKELNATVPRTGRCSTPSMSSATTVKVASVWKVGVLAVLLGAASWSL